MSSVSAANSMSPPEAVNRSIGGNKREKKGERSGFLGVGTGLRQSV